jgi:hypothetical protein
MKTGVEPDEKAIVIEAFSSVSKRLGRPKIDPKTEDANRKALGREPRPGILKIAKELAPPHPSLHQFVYLRQLLS